MKSLSAIKEHQVVKFVGTQLTFAGNYFGSLLWASFLGLWLTITALVPFIYSEQQNIPFSDTFDLAAATLKMSLGVAPLYVVDTILPAIIFGYIAAFMLYQRKKKNIVLWGFVLLAVFVLNGFWSVFTGHIFKPMSDIPVLIFYFAPGILLGLFMNLLIYTDNKNFAFKARLFLVPPLLVFGMNMALFLLCKHSAFFNKGCRSCILLYKSI